MTKASPISDIFPLDLTLAGKLPINGLIGYFHVWEITDTNGNPVLDGRLSVRFGDANGRLIPCTYNSKIEFTDPVSYAELSWTAQPGRSATILLAASAVAFEAYNAPTKQLVTSSIGAAGSHAKATVNNVAGVLAPANTLRQSLNIQNRGAASIFIGFTNASLVSDGTEIEAGASIVLDKTTAAIYAQTAAGSADVRLLTELSA